MTADTVTPNREIIRLAAQYTPAVPHKFYLRLIRLNAGGYTASGEYFGAGAPLYEYQCDDVNDGDAQDIRAYGRESAKQMIRKQYPAATFYN